MSNTLEKWRPICGYKGYFVSDYGRIKAAPNRGYKGGLMSLSEHRQEYKTISLTNNKTRKSFFVHRLVAQAFIPNPENKATVNHINGVKYDNRVCNLEWLTQSENNKHAFRTGLQDNRGDKHPNNKLTEKDVKEIKALKGKILQKEIAKMYGVNRSTIGDIFRGKTWSHV